MKQSTFGYILLVLFASCKAVVLPTGTFSETNLPAETDYSKPANWAALPTIEDFADLTPDTTFMQDLQSISEADVFFLHPTTYVGDKGEDQWNASCDDEVCNEKTEEGAIRYQARGGEGDATPRAVERRSSRRARRMGRERKRIGIG